MKDKVSIIEVGPRDGFQNIDDFIETPHKLEIIDALVAAGVTDMEVTSFVSPKAIPQMRDAATVASTVGSAHSELHAIALVPNAKGAQFAAENHIGTISCVISVSQSHNKANVARTREESVEQLRQIVQSFPALSVRLDVATAFGCPFEGKIDPQAVEDLCTQALDIGVDELVLCDTIGVANTAQVDAHSRRILALAGKTPVTLHLHDTRGSGLANMLAGYQAGIRRFEASAGAWAVVPLRPAPQATPPPRTQSTCLSRWASPRASTSRPISRPSSWSSATSSLTSRAT
jgi:hydroxymethylglutaryl-CoA lyase